jgi:hypothetical protein
MQFERACSLILAAETEQAEPEWSGHADEVRGAIVRGPIELPTWNARFTGYVAVLVVWVPPGDLQGDDLAVLGQRRSSVMVTAGVDAIVVMTNLEPDAAATAFGEVTRGRERLLLGTRELALAIDRHTSVRLALPSLLGYRDLTQLISSRVLAASSCDVEGAQALARVFWPTRAYVRASDILARHRFVVLTGPPEMGKTAIAQMLGLALMTDGWEVHECTNPDQLWSVLDAQRRQLFLADDAFGSTEFRPDAAERWAQSLGRLLGQLDEEHRLIWTSRPAPLKAGLRRVQRQRHAHRFPSPGEVLVDASELDLAEKTLILFRHAKARGLPHAARRLVRTSALTLVDHPHFTPERIRRLVSDRLDALGLTERLDGPAAVLRAVADELSTPTDAMRTSYRALAADHRQLLIALLDAPAGLIDERELAAVLRRHRPAGFIRPPGELIDRLTDHFLRVTPLGIGWVHPSWRDLVITELRSAPQARQRFLSSTGLYGVMLALSLQGGAAGERTLPLIIDDRDWDLLADRLVRLSAELEDQQLIQLFLALDELHNLRMDQAQMREASSLAGSLLGAVAHRWDRERRVISSTLLGAWYGLESWSTNSPTPPSLVCTWAELYPGPAPKLDSLEELTRVGEWLSLLEVLSVHHPDRLAELGFGFEPNREAVLGAIITAIGRQPGGELTPRAEEILRRVQDLASGATALAAFDVRALHRAEDDRWWSPQDIDAPPSRELVAQPAEFRRADVARILTDL